MLKRTRMLLIVCALLIGSLPPTAAQEEDLTTITLPTLTLEIGQSATLDAAIACAAEGGCSAFDIALAFDPAVTQINSAVVGPYLGDQVFTVENTVDNDAGTLHLVAAVLGDFSESASDILFTLTITAHGDGTSSITFTQLDIADAVGFPTPAEGIAGEITVMPEPDPKLGAALFADTGCAACHGETDVPGPAFAGMGERAAERIEDVSAEDYLRASILDPAAFVVKGYSPIMPPTYDDLLSDHETDSLIAYILTPPVEETAAAAPTATAEPTAAAEPEPTATLEPTLESATAEPTETHEPCVLTPKHGAVEVRLGPGFNRGILDYLPLNHTYTATGQKTMNDQSLWWQIDFQEGAEAWVWDEQVETAGGCAYVADVDAPPVVFGESLPSDGDTTTITAVGESSFSFSGRLGPNQKQNMHQFTLTTESEVTLTITTDPYGQAFSWIWWTLCDPPSPSLSGNNSRQGPVYTFGPATLAAGTYQFCIGISEYYRGNEFTYFGTFQIAPVR